MATDTFGLKNQNQTSKQSAEVASSIVKKAQAGGRNGQVFVSAAFGCPFEGDVPVRRVVELARIIADAGPSHIVLADTIGAAVPSQVTQVVGEVINVVGGIPLRCHFHNTRNTGLANAAAAVAAGIRAFDSSLGGIGGCPFAPKATGNIPTEDLVYMLHRMGFDTGTRLPELIAANAWLEGELGRASPSLLPRAGIFPDCAKNN